MKVFIDGRAEVYEHSGVLDDCLMIARLAPNTFSLLTAYNVLRALSAVTNLWPPCSPLHRSGRKPTQTTGVYYSCGVRRGNRTRRRENREPKIGN